MDIIQPYYTLSNKNNGAKLTLLFTIDLLLSHLINKLSIIFNTNLLVPWARMVKLSNEQLWLQNRRWSSAELSAGNLTFLKVNRDMSMSSPNFQVPVRFTITRSIESSSQKFTQYKTQGCKVNDLWGEKRSRDNN